MDRPNVSRWRACRTAAERLCALAADVRVHRALRRKTARLLRAARRLRRRRPLGERPAALRDDDDDDDDRGYGEPGYVAQRAAPAWGVDGRGVHCQQHPMYGGGGGTISNGDTARVVVSAQPPVSYVSPLVSSGSRAGRSTLDESSWAHQERSLINCSASPLAGRPTAARSSSACHQAAVVRQTTFTCTVVNIFSDDSHPVISYQQVGPVYLTLHDGSSFG